MLENVRAFSVKLILRPLARSDEAQALAAHREFPDWDFLHLYKDGMPWAEFVLLYENMKVGENLPKGLVPATFFLAEVNGELVGRVSIRHELNTYLQNYGGHIGYGVRPNFRRRGYATEILRQSLKYANEIGITKALLTCFDENVGSAAVIESCGGVLENIVELEGKPLRRYWIDNV